MYPKESLEIIGKMMNDTRLNVMKSACAPLLAWGWTSAAVSMAVYLGRLLTANPLWDYLWFLIPLIGLPVLYLIKPKDCGIRTAISGSLLTIWRMFTVLIVLLSLASFFVLYNVLPCILLILAVGAFITGELIRYPFLKYSSIPGFVLAAALCWLTGIVQIPLFAAAMLLMMVLPAYKIRSELRNRKYERA